MTIEEFIEARATARAADVDTITSALFHAEMDRRGIGPGCASFGSVWSRSERTATQLLAMPSTARELPESDQRAVASIWSDNPAYQSTWAVDGGGSKP
ncbi:hypothetical protein [Nocardia sp. NBC_00511]|uniref:hypothetical protein n=1 Tax=Nocardia sp. NBC_00511 TaxID=2903591 RepID=UPI0030E446C4